MCPPSGWSIPCTHFPLTINPIPTPVPTVMYAKELYTPWFPSLYSAIAHAFTSVSIAYGFYSNYDNFGPIWKYYHFNFGVLVIEPYKGSDLFKQTGPNVAIYILSKSKDFK